MARLNRKNLDSVLFELVASGEALNKIRPAYHRASASLSRR